MHTYLSTTRLLEEYPHTRQYFESFVMETSLGTETNKMKLNDHSQLFMKGIKMYLDYIDEPDALVGLLQTVALDHLDRLISTEEMMVNNNHDLILPYKHLVKDNYVQSLVQYLCKPAHLIYERCHKNG